MYGELYVSVCFLACSRAVRSPVCSRSIEPLCDLEAVSFTAAVTCKEPDPGTPSDEMDGRGVNGVEVEVLP